jgi:hypothetical protein
MGLVEVCGRQEPYSDSQASFRPERQPHRELALFTEPSVQPAHFPADPRQAAQVALSRVHLISQYRAAQGNPTASKTCRSARQHAINESVPHPEMVTEH